MEHAPYVLVVDDDVDILDAIRFMLEEDGYDVKTSDKADYAETLPAGDARRPDLIILDVLLSGKDGRTICKRLKEHPTTREIPILMISAHPGAEQSVVDVGADAFLAKPFSIDAMYDTIDRLLK